MKNLKKCLTLLLFGVAIVLSFVTMRNVKINYNLSDYLGKDTQTKIALNIIDDEFGQTGNIQVMVENITKDDAKNIKREIETIDNVINVNFDVYDETYYKNNNALYIVLVDGDDYSTNAKQVSNDIKDKLNKYENVEYGGTTTEKQALQESITSEMIYILVIALCLVIGILLITSESWVEPVVLLLCSGVAVLINKGTNVFFHNISYITNSISAILQLALSIDYSIVLLHKYKKMKEEYSTNDEAMKNAVKSVIKPVSASGLTTIAGLLALLFMSFRIGFDIGIVLIKGIVISLVTSLTLLPIVILLMDKILNKTKKKMFVPHGKFFYNISTKYNKVFIVIMLIVVTFCGIIQTNNKFIFSDTKSGNEEIIKNFGENNTIVIVYKNSSNNYQNEEKIIESINSYGDVLSSYTAYTNTVREIYDIEKATKKLELTKNEATLLYALYSLNKDHNMQKLSFDEFINYANELSKNDEDATEFVTKDIKDIINNIICVQNIMNNDNTVDEFYNSINEITLSNTSLSKFSINQMYGLYFYNTVDNKQIDFITMLDYMISQSTNENISDLLDNETTPNLLKLSQGSKQFNSAMNQEISKEEFKGYMYQTYNMVLSDEEVDQIYMGYYLSINQDIEDVIPYLNLLNYLQSINLITDEDTLKQINNYNTLYNVINDSYEYDQFLTIVSFVTKALTNESITLTVENDAIQQMYVMYFLENNLLTLEKIKGETFVNFVNEAAKQSSLINAQLKDNKNNVEDMLEINKYLKDKNTYTYNETYNNLQTLKEKLHLKVSDDINEDKISGVYIKYIVNNNIPYTQSIMAYELLDFINENKDTNELLIEKLDNKKLEKIDDANKDINKANTLFKSTNYSRMLLQISLKNESEETTDFVNFLSEEVKNVFGSDSYIAGEPVSVVDLQQTFKHDNLFITIFTLVSIFLIVMLIFRSLSLPLVLVISIQGAIFVTMATQLFNSGIFFMSYIVVSCILMGATIDYGILLSSTYVDLRKELNKKDALYKAIETAMPTVFTSGLILTVCGFVIHFISSQNSISTVGLLLGIGTISSVVMILVILPSILYLLDKFILKFTHK